MLCMEAHSTQAEAEGRALTDAEGVMLVRFQR